MMRFLTLLLPLILLLAGCSHLETRDATLIRDVKPVYPEEARLRGIEGRVVLEFTINEDGVPVDIQIVEATPEGVFELAAISAVSQWRYRPALKYGRKKRIEESEAVLNFSLSTAN